MQFLSYVLLEIDEACRHIQDGRIPHLRLALLLLDNAIEIQLYKYIEGKLPREEMHEKIRKGAIDAANKTKVTLPPELQELVDWTPMTPKEKNKIDHSYDAKLQYLSERYKILDKRLVSPLAHLHKYRNEAYHRAKVRHETIATAAKLLLDINCELLLHLPRAWTVYSSKEDYSWLISRFGGNKKKSLHSRTLVPNAVKELRENNDLSDRSVRQLLSEHLNSRIQDTLDNLEFILENTNWKDSNEILRASYEFFRKRLEIQGRSQKNHANSEKNHTTEYLNNLPKEISRLSDCPDKLEAFSLFSLFEADFENVENSVQALTEEVDSYIQLQIDIARGK